MYNNCEQFTRLCKQTNQYIDGNNKKMSISEGVSNSEGMSNSYAKISNDEVQITPLCIRYQTVGNSDWNPNIGQFM